jgi:hypothetical protein
VAVTSTPIFVQAPLIGYLDMSIQTACTTRAKTATASLAGANIVQLLNTTTNGCRIDSVQVNACATNIAGQTAANLVGIWVWDGTNAQLYTEVTVTATTLTSATVAAFTTTVTFANPLVLPSTYKLYASVSQTTAAASTALQVFVFGGSY